MFFWQNGSALGFGFVWLNVLIRTVRLVIVDSAASCLCMLHVDVQAAKEEPVAPANDLGDGERNCEITK